MRLLKFQTFVPDIIGEKNISQIFLPTNRSATLKQLEPLSSTQVFSSLFHKESKDAFTLIYILIVHISVYIPIYTWACFELAKSVGRTFDSLSGW